MGLSSNVNSDDNLLNLGDSFFNAPLKKIMDNYIKEIKNENSIVGFPKLSNGNISLGGKELSEIAGEMVKKCDWCEYKNGLFGESILCTCPSRKYNFYGSLIKKELVDSLDFCPDFSEQKNIEKLPKNKYAKFNEVWSELWAI